MRSDYEVVITGAGGFVGSYLTKEIINHYPPGSVLCLVNLSKPDSVVNKIKKLGLIVKRVDLLNIKTLTNLPKNPKIVIHLAAEVDTSRKDHRVNDIGTKNLYKALGDLNKKTHFIYIGTMITVVGRRNCKEPINEESKDFPTNAYTRTKLKAEVFLKKVCARDNFSLTVLSPGTIYGKSVRKNSLFDIVKKEIKKGSLIVRFNWPGRSAYIHVDDVVSAIIKISKKNLMPGKFQKYLLFSENLTLFEVSEMMHKAMNIRLFPIILPNKFWKALAISRWITPYAERFVSPSFYNQFWRFGIVVDDVMWAKTNKLSNKLKNWKPSSLENKIIEVI
jgi:nucleoside-diphosphate-sugar epimerase